YVIAKDAATNTVVIGPKERLLCARCEAGEANWLVADPGAFEGREVMAKFRYNTPATRARFAMLSDGHGPTHSGRTGRFEVEFAEPQAAVAAGQAIVLHDGDRVIGGGWIDRAG
ncbi:MAG: aminomethyltransferase beta-barrel domain-containing protein, partial [Phycisphaerales bacterium]